MSQELEGTLTNEVNLVGTFGTTGGGTTNYNDLVNKPSINNVTLQGNKTGAQLGLVSSTDLATVATTGSYNDLINKPTIPAAQVNSDWNASSGVAEILNKPTLAAVATSGAYSDLTGTPTIPASQVNSDWNASSGVAEILNKPTVYQNAAELPVSSSDPTDTKSYIDTGLSNIADYSTSEKTVGKWIDGKTVYQKVIPINFIAQATWHNVETINGITRIISADFLVYEGGNRSNGIRQGMFAEISTTVPYLVQIFNNTGYDIQVDYLILKYIKS